VNLLQTIVKDLAVAKIKTNLLRVQLSLPFIWHIMCILNYLCHEQLRVKHPIVLRYHPSRSGKHGSEYTNIEQDCPTWRNLKVQQFRIDDGSEQEDCRKGTGNESHEAKQLISTVDEKWNSRTNRMMMVIFSLGNWPMYILAMGYDSSSRRVNRCESSLNSRNFHCAKGV